MDGQRERLREERALFERYASCPTPALREALIRRFLPLARGLALRYARGSSEPEDDLVQVAALGLVKAVDRYHVDRGVAFSSYAVPTILGEVKRHFRDRTWSVHVPRDLQDLTLAVQHERQRLERSLSRSPTVTEIARGLDVCDADVLDALAAARAQRAESLDAPADSDRDASDTFYDLLGGDDPRIAQVESRASLDTLIKALPPRSRFILRLRFDHDMTQREIGKLCGVTQMQVSRILREAINRLRHVAEMERSSAGDRIAA